MSRTVEYANQLNRSCRCMGADVPVLRTMLDRELQMLGRTESIAQSHPHLYSELPVFVAPAHAQRAQQIMRAIETVVALPAYQELALARAPNLARRTTHARGVLFGYDFHITHDGPRLIEINTNAGGALLNVAAASAQWICCSAVAHRFDRFDDARALQDAIFAMFISDWRLARASQPLRTIAIVDDAPQTQYLYPEFLLFQKLFQSRGIDALIVASEELRYERGALTHDNRPIDLVYNRLTDFYFTQAAHAALAQAYADDAVVITPHPRAHALYADKRNLVVLSDERELRALRAPPDAIDVLLQGAPRTLPVNSVDADRWWRERKQWFFKPVAGFGGGGAYRGEKLTRKAFAQLLQGGYVAQTLTPPGERSGDADSSLKFDVRNYAYAGETVLTAARVYQGQTTNFRTAGGGFAPVFIGPLAQSRRH